MLLVKFSFPVLLSLGMVSQLCAQRQRYWGTADDGWLQDDVKLAAKSSVAESEEWLQENDVEPSRPRAADGLKALFKAFARFKHLKTLKTQTSESVTKGSDVSELSKTSTENSSMMVQGSGPADSHPAPLAPPTHHRHMVENDKSHRFTHSIRFGFGAPHGSLL